MEHWGYQNDIARITGIFLTCSNLIYSIGAHFTPKNENHIKINIAYTCMSLTSIILFVASFKKKNHNYNFAALIIVTFRNITRFWDFENTYSTMKLQENANFY
jgi:hypothetical protein